MLGINATSDGDAARVNLPSTVNDFRDPSFAELGIFLFVGK